ncbi:hypothetical protein ILUMI_23136 [Ignelater luminosus]|uniref:Uncharacterized protein n=1 Tax=Ignelater luminosus TaxID=2038154 RepID=A0A8K0G271_IGNLU|nr:hypothetical protein ILUMI_23136 [Ignelater luminosus]
MVVVQTLKRTEMLNCLKQLVLSKKDVNEGMLEEFGKPVAAMQRSLIEKGKQRENKKHEENELRPGTWNVRSAYEDRAGINNNNAKIGKEEEYLIITEGKSLHKETNENGNSLIQFAIEQYMKVVSTSLDHKNIHKITWISPNAQTKTQINYVLIEKKDHYRDKEIGKFIVKTKQDCYLEKHQISLERWDQYFKRLLNEEELDLTKQESGKQPDSNERERVEEPSEQEIWEMKKLKNNKSVGENGMLAEIPSLTRRNNTRKME